MSYLSGRTEEDGGYAPGDWRLCWNATWFRVHHFFTTERTTGDDSEGVRMYHRECYPCAWWRLMWNTCAADCCGKRPPPRLMLAFSWFSFVISFGLVLTGGIYAADYETTVLYQWHTPGGLIIILMAALFTIGYKYKVVAGDPESHLLADTQLAQEECFDNMRMAGIVICAGGGALWLLFESVYFWFSPPADQKVPANVIPAVLLLLSGLAMLGCLLFRFMALVFRAYEEHEAQQGDNGFM